ASLKMHSHATTAKQPTSSEVAPWVNALVKCARVPPSLSPYKTVGSAYVCQPTLVRTQHLPPPGPTAPGQQERRSPPAMAGPVASGWIRRGAAVRGEYAAKSLTGVAGVA